MSVDHLSLSTTPVHLFKANVEVSQGTGFFYVRVRGQESVLFLVTNIHVLTGHAPQEKDTPMGDMISFQFHQSVDNPGQVQNIRMPIFTKTGVPVWVQSSLVPEADLAVIPIPVSAYENCSVRGISQEWMTESQMKVKPTTAVTLIGYPYGYYDRKNALPIWKTGTIASEPEVDFDGKPLVTIDISAFPGMSGAPAFAFAQGTYDVVGGGMVVGNSRKFIGIYASMQMLREKKFLEQFHGKQALVGIVHAESLQLGHVWKAHLIDELISGIDREKWDVEILANLP